MEKFLGVGLVKATSIALYTIILIILLKVIFNKKPVKGLTEIINTI